MSIRDEDIAWYRELLAAAGAVSARRMFGGVGFYADGVMIALEAFGNLYLKTDDATRARFKAAGGRPFVYEGKGKPITMSYWTTPEDALDSADAMRPWALLALQAASAARKAAVSASPKKISAKKRAENKSAVKKPAMKKAAIKKSASGKRAVQQGASAKATAQKPGRKKSVGKKAAASRP